jgi:hypothetical protein
VHAYFFGGCHSLLRPIIPLDNVLAVALLLYFGIDTLRVRQSSLYAYDHPFSL